MNDPERQLWEYLWALEYGNMVTLARRGEPVDQTMAHWGSSVPWADLLSSGSEAIRLRNQARRNYARDLINDGEARDLAEAFEQLAIRERDGTLEDEYHNLPFFLTHTDPSDPSRRVEGIRVNNRQPAHDFKLISRHDPPVGYLSNGHSGTASNPITVLSGGSKLKSEQETSVTGSKRSKKRDSKDKKKKRSKDRKNGRRSGGGPGDSDSSDSSDTDSNDEDSHDDARRSRRRRGRRRRDSASSSSSSSGSDDDSSSSSSEFDSSSDDDHRHGARRGVLDFVDWKRGLTPSKLEYDPSASKGAQGESLMKYLDSFKEALKSTPRSTDQAKITALKVLIGSDAYNHWARDLKYPRGVDRKHPTWKQFQRALCRSILGGGMLQVIEAKWRKLKQGEQEELRDYIRRVDDLTRSLRIGGKTKSGTEKIEAVRLGLNHRYTEKTQHVMHEHDYSAYCADLYRVAARDISYNINAELHEDPGALDESDGEDYRERAGMTAVQRLIARKSRIARVGRRMIDLLKLLPVHRWPDHVMDGLQQVYMAHHGVAMQRESHESVDRFLIRVARELTSLRMAQTDVDRRLRGILTIQGQIAKTLEHSAASIAISNNGQTRAIAALWNTIQEVGNIHRDSVHRTAEQKERNDDNAQDINLESSTEPSTDVDRQDRRYYRRNPRARRGAAYPQTPEDLRADYAAAEERNRAAARPKFPARKRRFSGNDRSNGRQSEQKQRDRSPSRDQDRQPPAASSSVHQTRPRNAPKDTTGRLKPEGPPRPNYRCFNCNAIGDHFRDDCPEPVRPRNPRAQSPTGTQTRFNPQTQQREEGQTPQTGQATQYLPSGRTAHPNAPPRRQNMVKAGSKRGRLSPEPSAPLAGDC